MRAIATIKAASLTVSSLGISRHSSELPVDLDDRLSTTRG